MGRTWINNVIIYGFMFLGLAVSGYICYSKAQTVVKHDVCLVFQVILKNVEINVPSTVLSWMTTSAP